MIILLVVLQKKKTSNDPEYLKLYVDTEEAQLIPRGKFLWEEAAERGGKSGPGCGRRRAA